MRNSNTGWSSSLCCIRCINWRLRGKHLTSERFCWEQYFRQAWQINKYTVKSWINLSPRPTSLSPCDFFNFTLCLFKTWHKPRRQYRLMCPFTLWREIFKKSLQNTHMRGKERRLRKTEVRSIFFKCLTWRVIRLLIY